MHITKKAPATQTLKAAIEIKQTDLYDFSTAKNVEKLNQFIEKPIIVSGKISEITFDKSYAFLLTSEDNVMISCKFQTDQNHLVSNYTVGQHIKIKGIYKGSLNYLILLNCIVLKNN
ncbi:OB-fold protein [Aquimarina agarivorans]|uniref:OB-fold protein n=1 Tax=Aquimarina agarivorans TaxID=980584 RepID=UPI000248F286|nr:hypothetical protein [Aquimarina agarivorans]